MLKSLFKDFDNIIVLDTETTGLDHRQDEIIELAMFRVSKDGTREEYDRFIKLSPGKRLPDNIAELTGITEEMLRTEGAEKEQAANDLARMLRSGKALVVAYNAQFDLCFLYYFLARYGLASALREVKFLDAMTVYRDRRPFPHKLANAIEAYSLDAQNTHRAIDDTIATFKLLCAMEDEESDLERYINLFGYSAKYGVSGQRISSINYKPQGYRNTFKLYE